MEINWALVIQIGAVVVAVVSAVVASINVRKTWRYRPHWARGLDEMEREGQRLYNRTREDAETVTVKVIPRAGIYDEIARAKLVEADGYIEYQRPEASDGYIKIEWVRSQSQLLYVQDIVEADRRTLKQRWLDARTAWSSSQVRGRREKERFFQ